MDVDEPRADPSTITVDALPSCLDPSPNVRHHPVNHRHVLTAGQNLATRNHHCVLQRELTHLCYLPRAGIVRPSVRQLRL